MIPADYSRVSVRGRVEPGPIVVHTRDLPAWVRPGWTAADAAAWGRAGIEGEEETSRDPPE